MCGLFARRSSCRRSRAKDAAVHSSMSLRNIRDCMDYIVQFALPFICNPAPLKLFSYLLVALVHFLVLWSQHVFMWNSRFDCRGSGCPATSTTVMIAECAIFYVLLLLLLVSYWRCILTPPGSHILSLQPSLQLHSSPSLHMAVNIQPASADARLPSGMEGRSR